MSDPIAVPSASEIEGLINKIRGLVTSKYVRDTAPKVVPSVEALDNAYDDLVLKIPENGFGLDGSFTHLHDKILPGLSNQATENYLGFVTGGVTPAALLGDYITTLYDQNTASFGGSIAPHVENAALELLLDLLGLDATKWPGRLLTSGATASNIVGLAVAREAVVQKAGKSQECNVSKLGIHKALTQSGLEDIQILHCMSHSSVSKAASIIGLGIQSAVSCSDSKEPWTFDFDLLEKKLATPRVGSIVVVSFGEVNTGRYTRDIARVRALCDQYQAWLHIDGAFGIYSRILRDRPGPYQEIAKEWTEGLELGDSITGDSHKSLNVSYDSGFFFCRDRLIMKQVFQNPGAAYLDAGLNGPINPLDKGIENSRRFRALPLYSTLLAYGREGYRRLIEDSISYARSIAKFISESDDYTLLPDIDYTQTSTIVLFQANDLRLNGELNIRINSTRNILVTGTMWNGKPAQRIAVSNWRVTPDKSATVIAELKRVVKDWNNNVPLRS